MDHNLVSIGVHIRQPALDFHSEDGFKVAGRSFSPGWYSVKSGESSHSSWAVKLNSFLESKQAEQFADNAGKNGVECSAVAMGKPCKTADGSQLESRIFTVCAGDWKSQSDVEKEGREFLNNLPGEVAIIKYPDELPQVVPVRLTPPSGGTLIVTNEHGETVELQSPVEAVEFSAESRFRLGNIRIGIDFHWDHREELDFRGGLSIYSDTGQITAVNHVSVEDYLTSLLGSEMRPDWPLEALAAQAVAARSTILATRGRHHHGEAFDICHDDHCQCYQGAGRESELAAQALKQSGATLLASGSRIVDARYAKTCGGLSDYYHVAWENWDLPYLQPVHCSCNGEHSYPDLSDESALRSLMDDQDAAIACNPSKYPYPNSAVEMEKLFHWRIQYSENTLRDLMFERTGIDTGKILSIEPIERSISGRIRYLRVQGSDASYTIGKELTIRRLLSTSHLPSSAFVVTETSDGFELEGLGWGHGVGLCQIGSIALADNGWSWKEILAHYYRNTRIVTLS